MSTQSIIKLLLCVTCLLSLCLQTAFAQNQTPPEEPLDDEEKIESPLLVEPQTPEEQFAAADLMLRLAQPKLARKYLQQLMAGIDR